MKKPDKKNIRDILALTPLQEGILFHYLKDPDSETFIEQLSLQITGTIEVKYFDQAWEMVIKTNEMLRTLFRWENLNKPVQIILKKHKLQWEYYDLSGIDAEETGKRLEAVKQKDRKKKFDLNHVPFRVTLCKISQNNHEMIVSNHHIIYDGWSSGIILKEFLTAYDHLANKSSKLNKNFCRGFQMLHGTVFIKRVPLVAEDKRNLSSCQAKKSFKDFIIWINSQDRNKQKEYWENYLNGFESHTEIPVKKKVRKNIAINDSEDYHLQVTKETKSKIENFVKTLKVTPSVILYAAWGLLLQVYNNCNDVVFGTTVSGRPAGLQGIEETVGLFVNTLPLRVRTYPGETILELVGHINHAMQKRRPYENTSLSDIKQYSQLSKNGDLFDSLVVVENYPLDSRLGKNNSQLAIISYSMHETSNYDLTVGINMHDDIEITITYKKQLFDNETIVKLSGHFISVLETVVDTQGKKVHEIEILSDEEKKQLLLDFNDTAPEYPQGNTILELFAEQVERTPDRVAMVGQSAERKARCKKRIKEHCAPCAMCHAFTYRELNEKSDQLAYLLKAKGVKPNTIVGFTTERCVDMIIGIMAILKAGGAFLPIEPEYPEDRIHYMLEDGKVRILVKDSNIFGDSIKLKDIEVISIDNVINQNRPEDTTAYLHLQPAPVTYLAYIIYTSGSTGKPRGVMVEHQNLLTYIHAFYREFQITSTDTVLQQASFAFDTFIEEVFPVLLKGGKISIPSKEEILDIERLLKFISKNQVSILDCSPMLLNELNKRLKQTDTLKELVSVHTFISGGDVLKKEYIDKIIGTGRIYNTYGPTETTVCATYYRILPGTLSNVPIGRPISNYKVYILDRYHRLLPQGVPGELCVSGSGVTRGYLNNPELTTEKFGHDLWDLQDYHDEEKKVTIKKYNKKLFRGVQGGGFLEKSPPGRRRQGIYRTGDLARWQPDRNIEFLGRIDCQVKIRGYRVELGEVENRLLNHNAIQTAVVVERIDSCGDKYICAYIVLTRAAEFTNISARLNIYLSNWLPDFMIPSFFVPLEKIPLTSSGKVDRNALPEPWVSETGKSYMPPRNETEKTLVDIWSQLLDGNIGIYENFFDLGGHSLKAISLSAKIQRAFNVKVPLEQIFKTPFIAGLSRYINQAGKKQYTPVEKAEEKEYYSLSPAQKRLYIINRMETSTTAYNMPVVMTIEGELAGKKLEKAFRELIQRHESLRTSFVTIENEPVQRIHDHFDFKVEYFDFKINQVEAKIGESEGTMGLAPFSVESATGNMQPATALINSFIRPFDLSRAPLLRVGLIGTQHTPAALRKYILMVDMHHIITDGASIDILVRDFITLYSGEDLPPVSFQYRDYSDWQQSKNVKKIRKKQESYWLKQFEAEIPVLNLPIDYSRPSTQSFEGDKVEFEIDGKEMDALKETAGQNGVTLFMLLLSIYNVLLMKLSGAEDIVVGTPSAGRNHADVENIIGMFVNTLPLRNHPEGNKTFKEFRIHVKESTLMAFENQDYPLEDLVDQVVTQRDMSRNPLFDAVFALQNLENTEIRIPRLKLMPYPFENRTTKFDLSLEAIEIEQRISFTFEYCYRLFRKEAIKRFAQYFKKIITSVLANPGIRLADIEVITEAEKHRILNNFNNTEITYPKDKTIHQLFVEQVERTPDHVALVGIHQTHGKNSNMSHMSYTSHISYKELNQKSNQLSHWLKGKGVQPDTIVAIMVGRSMEMIIGMQGILKAGGAYLPIDPDYPRDRIDYMLKDSNVRILLTSHDFYEKCEKLSMVNCQLLMVNEKPNRRRLNNPPKESYSINNLQLKGNNLAYIIYTSGTTGSPKGVLAEHRNAVNVLTWYGKTYNVTAGTRVLQLTNYTFDPSVEQIFGTLLHGASLFLPDKELTGDIKGLTHYIQKNQIHIIDSIPLMLEELLIGEQRLGSLQVIISGGEKLKDSIKNRIIEKGYNLYNHYGPTETCIETLTEKCSQEKVTIGKAIANVTCYILDKYDNLLPVGVSGELCTAGPGVTRGYLNNPELTLQKFQITNYKQKRNNPPSLPHYPIYRTGDLAQWLPDGKIEFLGRIDHQVKIRGFRIELGEIENRLLNHKLIKEAIVIPRTDGNKEKYLCAYIVLKNPTPPLTSLSPASLDLTKLRHYLSETLPGYMIPPYFVPLEKIPLHPNGKVDWKTLPEPQIPQREKFLAPRNKIEEKLTGLWSEVLGIKKEIIGIDSNFFELSGHSLKATILAARIHKELGVNIPLSKIFKNPFIREQAEYIGSMEPSIYEDIEPLEKREYYPQSPAQKRLFLLDQMENIGTGYHMPAIVEIRGKPNITRIEQSFKTVIQRHESLRTSFHMINDKPVQKIHDQVESEGTMGLAPLSAESATRSSQPAAALISSFIRPFDLSLTPQLRVGLIEPQNTSAALRAHPRQGTYTSQEGKENKYLLMVDMHHIISDGLSMRILIEEFSKLYNREELPSLKIQYKDFSQWQNRSLAAEEIKAQEKYWLDHLAGEIPLLALPTDYLRPKIQSFAGKTMTFDLAETTIKKVKALTAAKEATLCMVLLTLYYILLSKLTGDETIIIGIPIAGRRHADLEPMIGMFVNTLVLKNQPGGEKTVNAFLQEVKENTLQALENQDYPYEHLVEQMGKNITMDTSRNPLFDVMFILQNTGTNFTKKEIQGLTLKPYEYEDNNSKFDLSLIIEEADEKFLCHLEYCTKLFKRETMRRFINYFKAVISVAVESMEKKISEIEIISKKEKQRILYDFNDTKIDYPWEKTIQELFEEQVERTPNHIALVGQSAERQVQSKKRNEERYALCSMRHAITYRELNKKSDQLAFLLKQKGVKPDIIVGLMVKRSIEMMIGILAVLKAGGAYLPIDPGYPRERIEYMLADSGVEILLTTPNLSKEIGYKNGIVYVTDAINRVPTPSHCHLSPWGNTPVTSLAYVIYTSGSTGKPKGVMIRQRNVVNFIFGMISRFDFSTGKSILALTTLCFDIFVLETLLPLTTGLKIVVADEAQQRDPHLLSKVIVENHIDILQVTPSRLKLLFNSNEAFDCLKGISELIVGGEAFPGHLWESLKKAFRGKFYNNYGPSETTVYSTIKELTSSPVITIGTPFANTRVYIVNKYHKLQPPGITGELLLGGDGIARGYLNKPEQTAEKFCLRRPGGALFEKTAPPGPPCKNFLLEGIDNNHLPIYLSGDLARWLTNGEIECLGRVDFQVKIRGFRIEPEEIENRLLARDDIKEAVVITREDTNKEKYLCAYVVPITLTSTTSLESAVLSDDSNAKETEWRDYLSRQLPAYMVPGFFIQVEKIPVTANGKIDCKALPAPRFNTVGKYEAPANTIEKKLAEIWSEILDVPAKCLSTKTNFFHLGGHSLKAAILVSHIKKEFHVECSLNHVFNSPTIKDLARFIKEAKQCNHKMIFPVEKKDYYPQSSAQKRLFILAQFEDIGTTYNMPAALEVEGDIKKKKLEDTLKLLIQRHESLRTSFHMIDDKPVQRVLDPDEIKFSIDYYELKRDQVEEKWSSLNNKRSEGTMGLAPLFADPAARNSQPAAALISSFIRPFDLSCAPLFRMGLIEPQHTPAAIRSHPSQERKEHKYLLMVDMHHIAVDGSSIGILIDEFTGLYSGESLPSLNIQYKDFTDWQKKLSKTDKIKEQEAYWQGNFPYTAEIPKLDLPLDYQRPVEYSFKGNSYTFTLCAEPALRLKQLGTSAGATLYMNLLTAFYLLLYKYTGQEDIIVGSVIDGRRHVRLQHIVGMFVNTLAIRNYPHRDKTYLQFLEEVKITILNAFENQDIPFEALVDKLNLERSPSRNPLFDVCFTMHNADAGRLDKTVRNVLFKSYQWETNISKFDISLDALERENEIHFNLEYCTSLFKPDTLQRYANHFINILQSLSSDFCNWHIPLKNIDILSEEEKKQILTVFNNTYVDYPVEKGVHQLFAAQVERIPDHVALIGKNPKSEIRNPKHKAPFGQLNGCDERHLSYEELNGKSNQLAQVLKEKGAEPDTIIGIMMGRSPEMIIGLLAILKAGGAYLPIDPECPLERLEYMLADSGSKVLLTDDDDFNCQLSTVNSQLLIINCLTEHPKTHLHLSPAPVTSLVYIIYTSGSTGKPKGVMVQHSSLVNRLFWFKEKYRLDETDVVLQKSVLTFDVSVCEIFRSLTSGGKLFLLPQRREKDPDFIIKTIGKYGITIAEFVPSMLNEFLDWLDTPDKLKCINSLRWVFVGAEVVSQALVNNFKQILNASSGCSAQLINGYGPTEATVDVTYFDCTASNEIETIPIGKPIANTMIFILNPQNPYQFMPIGVTGELCIYGESLARGYLNNTELTKQKFCLRRPGGSFYKNRPLDPRKNFLLKGTVRNHMQSCSHASIQYHSSSLYPITPLPHSPIYLTGDLARWLSDGNIQFLGRMDRQVKVRGFRIELEEIEHQLMRHDDIKEAVILAKEDGNKNKYLCAYIVSRDKIPVASEVLRNYLSRSLPNYMIPHYFIFLDEIPLTSNGKIDRWALPAPQHEAGGEYTPPRTELEKTMVEIWTKVLGHDKKQISIHDNFFEIGGDSLNAIRVCSQLKKSIGITIDISTFFSYQTINNICNHINLRSQSHSKESRENITRDLKNELTKKDKEKFLHELNKNTRLTSLLTQNKISREYPVSPLQKISLTISSHKILAAQILLTSYDFASHPTTGILEIKRVITKLIEENSLLRSIIINSNKKYLIREFDSFTNIELPYLDISDYSLASQQEILDQVQRQMKIPMDIITGLLYRVLVLKLPQGRYKILFAVNHLIFDGESSRILPEKMHHIHMHNSKKKKSLKTRKDFYDYVHFINRWNNRNIELEKHLDINEYRRSIKSAARCFKTGGLKIDGFELDMSMMKKELENLYHEIVLLSFAKSINSLFALDPVPIIIVSHGRHYKDGNFSNVIGDFHDYIPVSFTFSHGAPPGRILENFLNYKKYIRNKNLHFISLFANRKTNRSNLLKLLSPFSFNAMIGLYESVKNDANNQLALMPANKNMRIGMRPEIFSIEMVKSPGSEHLWINCSQNSQFEKERIKEEFIKNFTHLANELDGL